METLILTAALSVAVGLTIRYTRRDTDPNTRAHWHTYGDASFVAYQHTHWYANPHAHYTVAKRRSDVRADPYLGAARDVATH